MGKDKENKKDNELRTVVPLRITIAVVGVMLLKLCHARMVEDENRAMDIMNRLKREEYHHRFSPTDMNLEIPNMSKDINIGIQSLYNSTEDFYSQIEQDYENLNSPIENPIENLEEIEDAEYLLQEAHEYDNEIPDNRGGIRSRNREGEFQNNVAEDESEGGKLKRVKELDSLGYVINEPNIERDLYCIRSNSCQNIDQPTDFSFIPTETWINMNTPQDYMGEGYE